MAKIVERSEKFSEHDRKLIEQLKKPAQEKPTKEKR